MTFHFEKPQAHRIHKNWCIPIQEWSIFCMLNVSAYYYPVGKCLSVAKVPHWDLLRSNERNIQNKCS